MFYTLMYPLDFLLCVGGTDKKGTTLHFQAKSTKVSKQSKNPIYVWDFVIWSFQSIEEANEIQTTDQMFILHLIKFLAINVCIAKVLLVKHLRAPC